MSRGNPNDMPPMATMSSGAMPTAGLKPPRQVRPMSNTTATKPTGGQPEGQVYRPNRQPANLPPRRPQARPMGGGLMEQQNTLSGRGRMPPSMGQQQQGQANPKMMTTLQQGNMAAELRQSQAKWDNLSPEDRAKYEAGGTRRPSAGMLQQAGNANRGVAPQMMAQNQLGSIYH